MMKEQQYSLGWISAVVEMEAQLKDRKAALRKHKKALKKIELSKVNMEIVALIIEESRSLIYVYENQIAAIREEFEYNN